MIVNVSSDGAGFNYLDIQSMMFNNSDVAVFQLTNNSEDIEQLEITIEAIDKNKIIEVVNQLNTLLKTTATTFMEEEIIESEDKASITFTVTIEIITAL